MYSQIRIIFIWCMIHVYDFMLGHGKLLMSDGSFYEGEFNNGEISGSGVRKWTSTGNIYEGEFFRGELTGKGTMKYSNGSIYEGDWYENMRQGM